VGAMARTADQFGGSDTESAAGQELIQSHRREADEDLAEPQP
jgi:hypothetical protein